jgi:hypothetical protein
MTEIEMARECAKKTCRTAFPSMYDSPQFDDLHEVRSALAMHSMRQPEIDEIKADVGELVNGLRSAVSVLQCLEPQPNITANGISLTDLIAKHGEPK